MRIKSCVVDDQKLHYDSGMDSREQFTSFIQIDLDAVTANVQAIQRHVGSAVQVMGVVKANAYGHGMIPIAQAVLAAGAARLAVARPDEGVNLRRAGITAPVLVMGYALPAEAASYVDHDLIPTINTREMADALSVLAHRAGKTLSVHVKIDTGLSRYGVMPEDALPLIRHINGLGGLAFEGLYTHFASADEADKSLARRQLEIFLQTAHQIEQAGIAIPIRHTANSAATIDLPETHLDCVRPGIAIYGLKPSEAVSDAVALWPALSLHSHVARVHLIQPGTGVSYGWEFIARRPSRVALIPVGYGDGYPRILGNTGVALIRGQRAPVIGRVCMDQIMLDVTAIAGVAQDDPVTLIGEQAGERISAEEVARLAGTINYEITTRLMGRLPRVYLREGQSL
jgi:alanine racemase